MGKRIGFFTVTSRQAFINILINTLVNKGNMAVDECEMGSTRMSAGETAVGSTFRGVRCSWIRQNSGQKSGDSCYNRSSPSIKRRCSPTLLNGIESSHQSGDAPRLA